MQLTLQQQAILTTQAKFNFVMAAAGTGKTTTIIESIKNNNTTRFNYCSFNNEMLNTIIKRVLKTNLLSALEAKHKVFNFNSKGLNLFSNKLEVDASEFKQKMFEALEKKLNKHISNEERKLFWKRVCEYKKNYCLIKANNDESVFPKALQDLLDETFNFVWKNNRVCEFVDMEIWFFNYITKHNDLLKDIEFFYVDEFQDLDSNKFEILKKLILQAPEKTKFYFVGDYNQQIYGWREKEDSNYFSKMMTFCKQLTNDINVLPLSQCFRCDNRLIAQANALIGLNDDKGFGYEPMSFNDLHNEQQEFLNCVIHANNDFELKQNIFKSIDFSNLQENLILSRNNADLLPIQIFLCEKEIPYKMIGSSATRFFENNFNNAMIAMYYIYMRWNKNPDYVIEWHFLAKILNFILSKDEADKKALPLLDEIKNSIDITALNDFLKSNQPIFQFNIFDVCLKEEDYFPILKNKIEALKSFIKQRAKDIKVAGLEAILKDSFNVEVNSFFNSLKTLDKSDFLHNLYITNNVVSVSTIHAAKGLEYDNVIICNLNENHFAITPEERRVFYVAMTRSKQKLNLLCHTPNYFFKFCEQANKKVTPKI